MIILKVKPPLNIAEIASEMFVFLSLDTWTILEFGSTGQICVSVTVNPESLHSVCSPIRKNRIRFIEMGSAVTFVRDDNWADSTPHPSATVSLGRFPDRHRGTSAEFVFP